VPKVTYPLSLKVSLWLAANLLLLAILGASFFITQGGVGWSALVAGPSGDRVHALFNVIAGEAAAAAPGPARDAVLARFGEAYGAQFSLHAPGGLALAGRRAALPPALRERLEFRGPPRPFLGGLNRDRGEWPEGTEPAVRSGTGETADGRLTLRPRPDGEGPFRGEGTPFRAAELRPFRFISRTEDPPAYWVGLRVNFALAERERPGRQPPFILLARLDTLPGLLHLLGLQSWLLAAGAVLALSILFWLPLVRGITRSLRDLTAATGRIAEGRLDTRVDTRRRDELGHLGESVNRMAARLEAQQHGQKRFLGDVAHELCSPLARLQLATGILADQAPAGLRDTVGDVREEVQQISTLVNELLAFTKAGLQPRAITLGPVAVEPLAREVAAREAPGHSVAFAFPPDLRVAADADLLRRALGNLVRNAARSSPAGTPRLDGRRPSHPRGRGRGPRRARGRPRPPRRTFLPARGRPHARGRRGRARARHRPRQHRRLWGRGALRQPRAGRLSRGTHARRGVKRRAGPPRRAHQTFTPGLQLSGPDHIGAEHGRG
jgi:two-component system sensor histidine kinase CpxA